VLQVEHRLNDIVVCFSRLNGVATSPAEFHHLRATSAVPGAAMAGIPMETIVLEGGLRRVQFLLNHVAASDFQTVWNFLSDAVAAAGGRLSIVRDSDIGRVCETQGEAFGFAVDEGALRKRLRSIGGVMRYSIW
jgi:hypothetical protein